MITQIYKFIFLRPLVMLLIVSVLSMSFAAPNQIPVVIPSGTSVYLETVSTLTSDGILPGQIIDFKVRQDIVVDKITVIPAGSIAKGQVMRAKPAKGLGKEGMIEVQIKSVTAVDGTEVLLTGGNLLSEGEDRQTLAIVLGLVVCILFLTMKGKNAIVPAGQEVSAFTAGSTQINLE